MGKVNFTIDGKEIQAEKGITILQAARQEEIYIPTLCDHPALPPEGACRICLVEIEGQRALHPSCTYPISEGMEVSSNTPRVRAARKFNLELLISDHPLDCMTCEAAGNCLLQDLAYEYDVKEDHYEGTKHHYSVNDPNPFIQVDRNKCILCGRCVRACREVNGVEAISVFYRGFSAYIGFGADSSMDNSPCEFCGSCVEVCPTGALWPKLSLGEGRPWQVDRIQTTCPYCGVGCQLILEVKDNKIIKVDSAWDGPSNHGWTCVKGRFGYDFVHHPDRLDKPRVRKYLLDGKKKPAANKRKPKVKGDPWQWVEVDWETALGITANKMCQIRDDHGPESMGFLTSAKCLNEENYLMNKLARQVIGTNNIDHCARLCHSSTVVGLATAFGSGAMTNSIDDIADDAQAFFVIGSNTTENHPVIGMRIRQAVRQRGAKLIVADPRKIDLVDFAVLHLRHKPGTDIALVNGLMHIILANGWEDKEFIKNRTEGFDDFKAVVDEYTPERVSEITGVPLKELQQAAEIVAQNKPTAVLWAMGITQHTTGVGNVMSLANLQMLLGNMGIPGGGTNPLRGQNNVQGACDLGGLPNVYPGYQKVTSPEIRSEYAKAWGLTEEQLSLEVGLTATEMMPLALEGKLKAIYILGEDPLMSEPDTNHIRQAMETCDLVILQEIFPSETSPYADVLLPGASFAEKDGTFTNTERRVQLVHKAVESPGIARPDWWIVSKLAKKILKEGKRQVGEAAYSGWDYQDTAEIMDEIAALTPIYAGVSLQRLLNGETLQWPVKDRDHPGTPILHVGQFARGLGLFTPVEHIPPVEMPDKNYPTILSTGRVLYHWHGGQMTRRSKGLLEIYPEALIEVNDFDAEKLGLNGNKRVRVSSRRGTIEAQAMITDRVPPGMVFANFHFPETSANELTIAALDPVAKIPEFKVCAVKVEAV